MSVGRITALLPTCIQESSLTRSMLRGLASFASRSDRVARRIVVFLGERRQLLDGVEVLPMAELLEELPG